jgi:hypothetical protein
VHTDRHTRDNATSSSSSTTTSSNSDPAITVAAQQAPEVAVIAQQLLQLVHAVSEMRTQQLRVLLLELEAPHLALLQGHVLVENAMQRLPLTTPSAHSE